MSLLSIGTGYIAKLLPISYAIIGFGVLVIVHEFGHFVFCKAFNIYAPTFSIGFGPKLVEKKIGETTFAISAIPLGGYVENLYEAGPDESHLANRAMKTKPYWQKFIVLMGGIAFNIIFAYVAFSLLFMLGAPKTEIKVKSVLENSIAQASGLESGDTIIRINESDISKDPKLFASELQKIKAGASMNFQVKRNGDIENITINIPEEPSTDKKLKSLQPEDNIEAKQPKLGIEFIPEQSSETEKYGFFESIKKGVLTTHVYIYQIAMAFKVLFTERNLKHLGGPVMMLSQSAKVAQKGLIFLLGFLAVISINLAILNLLPLTVLDGGQLLFITIETIIGRDIPVHIKNIIDKATIIFLLMLTLYITFNDVRMLIAGKLG